MRRFLLIVWVFILSGCRVVGHLDISLAQQIELDIQAALGIFDIPGAAFALVWPDGIYTAGLGFADLTSRQPVTSESHFAVASMIKPVAGAWIADQLRVANLTWETRLQNLWPTLDLGIAGDVTIAQAIHQTSGYLRDDWVWIGRDLSVEDLAVLVRQSMPIAPAGQVFTYNNVLFALTLRGIEAYTGAPFPIFSPDVTGYDRSLDGELIPLTDNVRQAGMMSVILEAGISATDAVTMLTTLLDDENVFAAQTTNAVGAECCPLGADVRYGRAIFVEQYMGVTLWLHDGDGLGFTSVMVLDPASKIGIFITANRGGADDFIHAVRYSIIERSYGIVPTAMTVMRERWERDVVAQQDLALRAILPPESDSAFVGDYETDMGLTWMTQRGLTLYRGSFSWRLRSLAPSYAVFDHGPLIGHSVDLVCVDRRRRIVSGEIILGIGDKC
jgi:CubicO group peptidase (beta-lactamase class C family)